VSLGLERSRTVIGANSEAHLEAIVDRLKRDFEVEASVGRPAVAYLESLTRAAEGSAKHVGITLGQGEYAHVSLRVHPGEAGSGYRFEDATIGGSIPKPFMSSIDIGIRESMANGVLRGYPIVDVRVEVYDGSYHDTDSTDTAFQTAAALAFQQASKNAEPVVLEPVMQVVVRTDDRHAKSVLDSLRMRRGEIQARMHEPDQEVITARVPLAELFGFEGRNWRAEQRALHRASVWNRLRYVKDPDTGKRVSRPNSPSQWITTSVPELRIVDDELWSQVKARQAAMRRITSNGNPSRFNRAKRPKFLFSGLTKCGECGGGYVIYWHDRLACFAARARGTCTNRHTISRREVEERVLVALRDKLMRRDLFEEFCREYVRELNRLRMEHRASISNGRTELAGVDREIRKLIQAIKDGVPGLSIKDELYRSNLGRHNCNRDSRRLRCRSCCTHEWPMSIARKSEACALRWRTRRAA
jgi:hypothetical protein